MRNTETNPSLGGTMYYTTLNRIQECDPSDNDWKALLSHLDKTEADDTPLSLLTILEATGLSNAVWALRAVDEPACERDARLFAVRCVRQMQHLLHSEPTMKAAIEALDVAEWHGVGAATDDDLGEVCDAAYKVWEDWNEADMAVDSACAAACAASGSVARERAEDAACAAALAAAYDAYRALNEDSDKALQDATWNAANKAAHAIQEIDFRAIFCGDA